MTIAVVFDLETQTATSYKRKANSLDKRNKIIVSAYQVIDMTTGETRPVRIEYSRTGIPQVSLPYEHMDVLVGQNIKFDLLYIWDDPHFREWLRCGGKIFDTMVGEYLLTAQAHTYASLNDLSLKYGGSIKDDKVKEFWDAGIDTPDIDPDILLPYAEYDILNTTNAYISQMGAIRSENMRPLVEGYMDHLLALTEMEFNGLYFDLEEAQKLRAVLEEERAGYRTILQGITDTIAERSGAPQFELNFESKDQLSAIIFSTPIKIITRTIDGVYGPKTKKAGQPKVKLITTETLLKGFDIDPKLSRPCAKKGLYSTDEKSLVSIQEGIPADHEAQLFVATLLKYRTVQKKIATYLYGASSTGAETGMIPLVYKTDGCIHHTLDMVQTKTGRVNGRNPNMQNVPRELRHLFSSRYGKDGLILEFDYSSMEIGVSAYLTQSERLMEDLRNGVDFHLKRASYVAEISYDEAVANYARDPEVWKEKRREAKAISFAKAYGAHPEKISEDTGLPLAVVEKVFKAEDAEYPEIADFNNQVEGQAKLNRIPSQKLLQIRDKQTRAYSTVPGEQEGIGYYRSATGKKYHFIERGSDSEKLRASGKGIFRYFKSTEIANYPVQGTAADIMAFTVSKVFRYLLTLDSPDIKMINEVHDSLVLDVKDQATADLHGPKIKEILEGVKDATKSIVGLDFNVFIPVDFKYGQVWGGGE
jgi:DNA polymerase I-like protein with 3'-5' exonuclease and polymerase domains